MKKFKKLLSVMALGVLLIVILPKMELHSNLCSSIL